MPIVIFLIGIAVRQRHHSQVRKDPWTTFFNGDCASNKLTVATLQTDDTRTRTFLSATGGRRPEIVF
jgi:hypothetical protein